MQEGWFGVKQLLPQHCPSSWGAKSGAKRGEESTGVGDTFQPFHPLSLPQPYHPPAPSSLPSTPSLVCLHPQIPTWVQNLPPWLLQGLAAAGPTTQLVISA